VDRARTVRLQLDSEKIRAPLVYSIGFDGENECEVEAPVASKVRSKDRLAGRAFMEDGDDN
jgi:hypothetical protein